MAATGIKRESLGDFFVGQGDMVFFDPLDTYKGKTIADFRNGKSFGNVKEDSTQWTGEEVSTTVVKNEQGNAITTIVTAGTLGFEAVIAEMDNDMVKLLLKGKDITVNTLTPEWIASASTATAVGFGVELPVITRPIMITNESKNKTLVFPKGKIVSALVMEDKMIAIKISVSAESIDTDTLTTGMILNGDLKYFSGVA